MSNSVNHPQHYGGEDNTYEAIKVIRAWNLGFNLGNTIKYISRAGKKDPQKEIEDLEKALWYLQDEINFRKKQSENICGQLVEHDGPFKKRVQDLVGIAEEEKPEEKTKQIIEECARKREIHKEQMQRLKEKVLDHRELLNTKRQPEENNLAEEEPLVSEVEEKTHQEVADFELKIGDIVKVTKLSPCNPLEGEFELLKTFYKNVFLDFKSDRPLVQDKNYYILNDGSEDILILDNNNFKVQISGKHYVLIPTIRIRPR